MLKTLRKILKLPLTLPLRLPFIRQRAAYHFNVDYFADLKLNIPLGNGFSCPVLTRDSLESFSEIFVAEEYGAFLDEIPLPRRWLDIGCHTGYFTLFLAWKHALAGSAKDWHALLVDADPRMEMLTRCTLEQNHLLPQCEFRSGMISTAAEAQSFALREGMGSSANTSQAGVQEVQKIRVVSPAEILAALPPPYDLIKIDIEGGEVDFMAGYQDVYAKASAIMMEWHSPDREGSVMPRLRAQLEETGFHLVRELRPKRELHLESGWFSSGVQLYRRTEGI